LIEADEIGHISIYVTPIFETTINLETRKEDAGRF
jgi:hypothetical protein